MLLLTCERCVFDAGVCTLRFSVCECVRACVRPGRLTSLFPPSPERRRLPSVVPPFPTSVTPEPPPEQRIYKQHARRQRKNSISFVFHKGGGQVLAES